MSDDRNRTNTDVREDRLRQLRRNAQATGQVDRAGIRPKGAPWPRQLPASSNTGYYGAPVLKTPAWTWEVPVYFFVGGIAGAAAIVGGVSRMTGAAPDLVSDARDLAAMGGLLSPPLLIADLGMPSRFLHMLRVFKIQSPMSVGSWSLVMFSTSSASLALLDFLHRRGGRKRMPRFFENAFELLSVLSGAVLSTYTGVLIGATAIPVWNQNVGIIPIHFAASGMGSAVSLLELKGHSKPALNSIGIASALTETVIGASLELGKDRVLKPLRKGWSGWLTRIGGLLSGPLPLVFRLLSFVARGRRKRQLRKAAALSTVAGSLVTRFAWIQAGQASARDPGIPLELPEEIPDR